MRRRPPGRRPGCGRSAAATREAAANAARHAGTDRVDVYVEVEDDVAVAFVRDRGVGFDPDAVPDDRRGVAESVVGRMARVGGEATVRSRPGEGTEVRLRLPLGPGRPCRSRRVVTRVPGRRPRAVPRRRAGRAGAAVTTSSARPVTSTQAVALHPRRRTPDVVLLDVHLPGGGGVAVVAGGCWPPIPDLKFLALSVSDAPDDVIAVIRAGARGYVTKSISGAELSDAIERVARGDAVFSPRLAGFVLDAFAGAPTPRPPTTRSSTSSRPASATCCGFIARGYTYKEVASELSQREDGRDPRLGGAPQAPALEPPRAHPLGHRPPHRLISEPTPARYREWPLANHVLLSSILSMILGRTVR